MELVAIRFRRAVVAVGVGICALAVAQPAKAQSDMINGIIGNIIQQSINRQYQPQSVPRRRMLPQGGYHDPTDEGNSRAYSVQEEPTSSDSPAYRSGFSGVPVTPSFRCTDRLTAVEATICQNTELSRLDREMAGRYVAALNSGVNPAWLKSTKVAWLARRNDCDTSVTCLRAAYLERISEIPSRSSPLDSTIDHTGQQPGKDRSADAIDRSFDSSRNQGTSDSPDFGTVEVLTGNKVEQLLMAARPDLYKTDLDALHYEARVLASDDPQCKQAQQDAADEIGIADAVASARALMSRDLDTAKHRGATGYVSLSAVTKLGSYDPEKSQFAYYDDGTPLLKDKSRFTWNFDRYDNEHCHIFSGLDRNSIRFKNDLLHQHQIALIISGGDQIQTVPASHAQARQYLNITRELAVIVTENIRVHYDSQGFIGQVATATTTLSKTGEILARYNPAQISSPDNVSTEGTIQTTASSPQALALNVLHYRPDALKEGALSGSVTQIIEHEQRIYASAAQTNEIPPGLIFAEDDIAGHDARFITHDMIPKYKQYLVQSAARVTSRLRSGIALAGGGNFPYDSDHQTLRLQKSSPFLLDLPRGQSGNSGDLNTAPTRDGLAIYVPSTDSSFTQDAELPVSSDVYIDLKNNVPESLIALDHVLTTPNLNMPKDRAEELFKTLAINTSISSHVVYTVEGLLSNTPNGPILKARLNYVIIAGPKGEKLARFEASEFPPAGDIESAAAAADQEKREAAEQGRQAKMTASLQQQLARDKAQADETTARQKSAADQEQTIANHQLRPETPFGPELAHLRLGMHEKEAEEVIRKHMEVVAVVEPKPGSWGYAPSFLAQKTFASAAGADIVTLFIYNPAGDRIVGISRRQSLPVPAIGSDDLSKMLAERNGPAVVASSNQLLWGDELRDHLPRCTSISSIASVSGYAFTEGSVIMRGYIGTPNADEIARASSSGYSTLGSNDPLQIVRDLRECPTMLSATWMLNGKDPSLTMAVTDGSWLSLLIASANQSAAPERVEAVKDILDH